MLDQLRILVNIPQMDFQDLSTFTGAEIGIEKRLNPLYRGCISKIKNINNWTIQ